MSYAKVSQLSLFDNKKSEKTLIFIKRAKAVHGDRYDYSDTEYIVDSQKVLISCKEHGCFLQVPRSHISNKSGCPKCGLMQRANLRRWDKEEFLKRAFVAHGDTYNYDKSIYVDYSKKIVISCKKHGDFEQTAANHIGHKKGCLKCGIDRARGKALLTKVRFVSKAKVIHGNYYNYSQLIYKSAKENVLIVCPKHGEFYQTADTHLSGCGCPKCASESRVEHIKGNPIGYSYTNWVEAGLKSNNFKEFSIYVLKCWNDNEIFYKIGKTYRGVKKRFCNKKSMPYKYEIIKTYKSNDGIFISELEIKLHLKNKKHSYKPKIKFDGISECFSYVDLE